MRGAWTRRGCSRVGVNFGPRLTSTRMQDAIHWRRLAVDCSPVAACAQARSLARRSIGRRDHGTNQFISAKSLPPLYQHMGINPLTTTVSDHTGRPHYLVERFQSSA